MENKKLSKRNIFFIVVAVIAICFIVFGIFRKEVDTVFTKAVNVCMECIGFGK